MEVWTTIATIISTVLGAGGVVKLYQLYKTNQKLNKSDTDYILQQYRDLIEVEKEARRRDGARLNRLIKELEESLHHMETRHSECTSDNIRLKAENNQVCSENERLKEEMGRFKGEPR